MNKELINSIKDLTAAVLVNSTLLARRIHAAKEDIPPEKNKELADIVLEMWKESRKYLVP